MTTARSNLVAGKTITLDAAGGGEVLIGPDSGPVNWEVTSGMVQTNRRGQAPIPSVQLFLETADPVNSLGGLYDGSFAPFSGNQRLSRGQHILAVWTGGQAGDRATLTLNGEMWN